MKLDFSTFPTATNICGRLNRLNADSEFLLHSKYNHLILAAQNNQTSIFGILTTSSSSSSSSSFVSYNQQLDTFIFRRFLDA